MSSSTGIVCSFQSIRRLCVAMGLLYFISMNALSQVIIKERIEIRSQVDSARTRNAVAGIQTSVLGVPLRSIGKGPAIHVLSDDPIEEQDSTITIINPIAIYREVETEGDTFFNPSGTFEFQYTTEDAAKLILHGGELVSCCGTAFGLGADDGLVVRINGTTVFSFDLSEWGRFLFADGLDVTSAVHQGTNTFEVVAFDLYGGEEGIPPIWLALRKHTILLGETKYYQAKEDPDLPDKLDIVELSSPSAMTGDGWLTTDVWHSNPVTNMPSTNGRVGVYWETEKPIAGQIGHNLARGLIRLVGRYWHPDTAYKVTLTASTETRSGSLDLDVKKPARLGNSRALGEDVNGHPYSADSVCVRWGGVVGIAPQYIKGQCDNESVFENGRYKPAYRYEPWTTQFSRDVLLLTGCPFWVGSTMGTGAPVPTHPNTRYMQYVNTPRLVWWFIEQYSTIVHNSAPMTSIFGTYNATTGDLSFRAGNNNIYKLPTDAYAEIWTTIRVERHITPSSESVAIFAAKNEARSRFISYMSEEFHYDLSSQPGLNHLIAQSRVASSYGPIQLLYTNARSLQYSPQPDAAPELLNDLAVFGEFAMKALERLGSKAVGNSSWAGSNWQRGYDNCIHRILELWNSSSYADNVMGLSQKYPPKSEERKFFVLFFTMFVSLVRLEAQLLYPGVDSETATALQEAVQSQIDTSLTVLTIMSVDSAIGCGDSRYHLGPVEDRYQSLEHTFIFQASRSSPSIDDTGITATLGIYRDGILTWESQDSLSRCPGLQAAKILAVKDINNDGSTDILSVWQTRGSEFALWITEWDGQTGRSIVQASGDEDWVESRIVAPEEDSFDIADVNGDGIWEVRAMGHEEVETDTGQVSRYRMFTYAWDGQKYGVWPNTPQPDESTIFPRANLQVNVSCAVDSAQGYSYVVSTNESSDQCLSDIAIAIQFDSSRTSVTTARSNWGGYWWGDIARWDCFGRPEDFIRPGSSDRSFYIATRSASVPHISVFYAQGYNGWTIENDSDLVSIYGNSFRGLTISPSTPPTVGPFASVTLTDTLLSYTSRSGALDWILDQFTADKYTGLFTRVHSDLDTQDKGMAILRLDSVLAQVHQDSAGHLTSEAYALLRFNTEYLQTLIPEDPLPIQLWYFTATVITDRHVELDWGTLSEENNYGFFVQKSQSETTEFTDIPGGFVAGHGTTNDPHEYSWIDTSTSPGQWYYRLKQVDFDGTLHYTDAERVYIPEELQRTQIVNFKACILMGNGVYMEWTTLSEYQCDGFYVQKEREGEGDFLDVNEGFVSGHGTTGEQHMYSFTDTEGKEGKWFYRLKHQGDGTEWYSDTIHLSITGDGTQIDPPSAEPLAQQQVRLDWTSRREVNNRYFEIQVSRGDSLRYRPVPNGRVLGHGTSTQRWKYTYRDTRPSSGVWYYRLKQVNASRQARYTRGIRVSVR